MSKAHTAALMRQSQVWRKMLTELHPKEITGEDAERVEAVEKIFLREARLAMVLLINELDRALANENWLERDLMDAKRALANANRLLKEARAKNAKLRKK